MAGSHAAGHAKDAQQLPNSKQQFALDIAVTWAADIAVVSAGGRRDGLQAAMVVAIAVAVAIVVVAAAAAWAIGRAPVAIAVVVIGPAAHATAAVAVAAAVVSDARAVDVFSAALPLPAAAAVRVLLTTADAAGVVLVAVVAALAVVGFPSAPSLTSHCCSSRCADLSIGGDQNVLLSAVVRPRCGHHFCGQPTRGMSHVIC